jgi:hypothetical protein
MITIVPILIVIIQCCLLEKQCYAASFEDVNKLYKNLTTRYNRYIRPADDQSHVTVIMTSFYLVKDEMIVSYIVRYIILLDLFIFGHLNNCIWNDLESHTNSILSGSRGFYIKDKIII